MNLSQYRQYTFEDFIMDSSFRAWVLESDAESRQFWEQYLARYPEQKSVIREAIQVVQHLQIRPDVPGQGSQERIWQALESRFDALQAPQSRSVRPALVKRPNAWRWASAIAVLLVCAVLLWWLTHHRTRQIHTAFGEIEQVILPDGSKVTLNSNSTLSYGEDWPEQSIREAWLEGEAFFEVTHKSSKQPFVVYSGEVQVEVLGTTFNVATRRGETQVVLQSGSVKLQQAEKPEKSIFMKPNDLVDFRKDQQFRKKLVQPKHYLAWRQHKMIFDDTPMQEIVLRLRDLYGLEVIFEDKALADHKLTGEISTRNLDFLLSAIGVLLKGEVQREGQRVLLRKAAHENP